MSKARPFRFGVQEDRVASAAEWREKARHLEAIGCEALYLADHFKEQFSPIAAMMAAADATTTLKVGSLVFDNDYRHPVVLAREMATVDVLSGGRLHLGIGAGWLESDYRQAGIAYDSPGTRIERLEESVKIIKGMFAGGPFTFTGKHYSVKDVEGSPLPLQKPHPPLLLGGGGPRMLRLAAREADIVHVNYDLREGRVNRELVKTGMADRTAAKLEWVREAAGERFEQIELGFTIFLAVVTDDRESMATTLAAGMHAEPSDVLEMPHFLIGTVDQMADALVERRERYGFSFVVLPGESLEPLEPLVERLAGN